MNADGWREFAVDHNVDAVRRGIDAMRRVRNRNVARVFRSVSAVDYLDAAHLLVVAALQRLFNALDVENDHPRLLVVGHLGKSGALVGIVAARDRVLALIVGVGVVEIAVHQHLPGDRHRVAVDRRVDRPVVFRVVQVPFAVIRDRDHVLAVGENVAGARELLRTQAMDVGGVGDLDDLVGLHDVATDASHPAIRLVVHKNVAPVVGAVGERHVRMMRVAVDPGPAAALQEFARLGQQALSEDFFALIGQSPPSRAVAVEHRNAHQFAPGRQHLNTHLAGLPAAVDGVIFIEVAGLDLGARRGVCSPHRFEVRAAARERRHAGDRGSPQHSATAYAGLVFWFTISHGPSSNWGPISGAQKRLNPGQGDDSSARPRTEILTRGGTIVGDDVAANFSLLRRRWIMTGQSWSWW